jgi:hypothetical protein
MVSNNENEMTLHHTIRTQKLTENSVGKQKSKHSDTVILTVDAAPILIQ